MENFYSTASNKVIKEHYYHILEKMIENDAEIYAVRKENILSEIKKRRLSIDLIDRNTRIPTENTTENIQYLTPKLQCMVCQEYQPETNDCQRGHTLFVNKHCPDFIVDIDRLNELNNIKLISSHKTDYSKLLFILAIIALLARILRAYI